MLSLPFLFVGAITGLLIVCIFNPVKRIVQTVPTPHDNETFHTKTGCVKIRADTTPCTDAAVSLNVLVGK